MPADGVNYKPNADVRSFGEQSYFKAFEHQTHHRGQTTLYCA